MQLIAFDGFILMYADKTVTFTMNSFSQRFQPPHFERKSLFFDANHKKFPVYTSTRLQTIERNKITKSRQEELTSNVSQSESSLFLIYKNIQNVN